MTTTKWAQLSPLERAYKKAKDADDRGYSCLRPHFDKSKEYQRGYNRYYQLLGHWCKLKKESENAKS